MDAPERIWIDNQCIPKRDTQGGTYYLDDDECQTTEYVRKDLFDAARKVKPLKWHALGDRWNTVTSGRIQITQRGVSPYWVLSCSSPETDLEYGTLDAAKEAAQKEHERRVLSALTNHGEGE